MRRDTAVTQVPAGSHVGALGPSSADMPAVAVEQVERHFTPAKGQPIHAVGPVSLDIGTGEFVCLVGPSGCGKSTLLRMVAGLTRPSTGRIGLNISPPGKGRQPLSMVFQDYGIYPWKTVEANVRFGLDLAGVPRREGSSRPLARPDAPLGVPQGVPRHVVGWHEAARVNRSRACRGAGASVDGRAVRGVGRTVAPGASR